MPAPSWGPAQDVLEAGHHRGRVTLPQLGGGQFRIEAVDRVAGVAGQQLEGAGVGGGRASRSRAGSRGRLTHEPLEAAVGLPVLGPLAGQVRRPPEGGLGAGDVAAGVGVDGDAQLAVGQYVAALPEGACHRGGDAHADDPAGEPGREGDASGAGATSTPTSNHTSASRSASGKLKPSCTR